MSFLYSVLDPMEMRQVDGLFIVARLAGKQQVNRHERPQTFWPNKYFISWASHRQ